MSMVILSWIAHTGYLLWEPQQNTTNAGHHRSLPCQVKFKTPPWRQGQAEGHSRSQSSYFTDITAQVIMTHTEATSGHDIGIIATTLEVAHNAYAPHTEITAINHAMTHHTNPTADHPYIEIPQPTTPEIEVDSIHVHPTNHPGEICTGHIHIPADHKANHTSRRTLEWK